MECNLKGFRPYGCCSFIGSKNGQDARKFLKLDEVDATEEECTFTIPADTVSLNPSFFGGLLLKSIQALGEERYAKKYRFVIETDNEDQKKSIEKNLIDGFRNVQNMLSDTPGAGRNVLSHFY